MVQVQTDFHDIQDEPVTVVVEGGCVQFVMDDGTILTFLETELRDAMAHGAAARAA